MFKQQILNSLKELNKKEMKNFIYYYLIKHIGIKDRKKVKSLLNKYGV